MPKKRTLFSKSNWPLLLLLSLMLAVLMSGCLGTSESKVGDLTAKQSGLQLPDAPPQVGAELKAVCWTQDPTPVDMCPALHAWLAKVYTLGQQLEVK